jgi:hypothetical protein
MNSNRNRLIHIEAVESVPITCPACAAELGSIDLEHLGQHLLWEEMFEAIDIDPPAEAGSAAEAGVTHGKCPSCGAALVSFLVLFECDRGEDAPAEEPRLSAALHAATFTGWAMIEHTHGGAAVTEHLFGPIPGEHAEVAFDRLREILPDLPRPGVASEENVL